MKLRADYGCLVLMFVLILPGIWLAYPDKKKGVGHIVEAKTNTTTTSQSDVRLSPMVEALYSSLILLSWESSSNLNRRFMSDIPRRHFQYTYASTSTNRDWISWQNELESNDINYLDANTNWDLVWHYDPRYTSSNNIWMQIENIPNHPTDDSWRTNEYWGVDCTATNVEVICNHEPVVVGTNGMGYWIIHFK